MWRDGLELWNRIFQLALIFSDNSEAIMSIRIVGFLLENVVEELGLRGLTRREIAD